MSVRQECLDHLLIFQERQLQRVLNAYMLYFNQARPIKASSSTFPIPRGHRVSLRAKEAGWLPFRSWLGCTMTTERRLKEDPSD